MTVNILVGKTLTGLQIAADKQALRFLTTDGEIIALCDGDCCSYTWVEHVELPARGFPALVISADDLDMHDLEEMPHREIVAYYGFKIITDKGDLLIDYRNESNGYYGGNLCWPTEYFCGGVHGQNKSSLEWNGVM